jgi:hypothetical protein
MKAFGLLTTLLLAGCGGGYDRYDPPTVDTRNVDPIRYNKDLADCTDKKRAHGWIGDAQMISDCMTRRGYNFTNSRT